MLLLIERLPIVLHVTAIGIVSSMLLAYPVMVGERAFHKVLLSQSCVTLPDLIDVWTL